MRGTFQRIASWRWFRVAAPFLVGTALFMMGVVYLNLNKTVDKPGFYVSGGSHGLVGKPAAFRLSSKLIDSSQSLPVTLDAVRVDGKSTDFEAAGSVSSTLRFQLPSDAIHDTVRVDLDVRAGSRIETVGFDFPILQSSGDVVISGPQEAVSKVTTSSDNLRVDVLPEHGVLALGMTNNVLIRVRDGRGVGLSGLTVRVMQNHCLIPPGPLTLTTDPMGLAEFKLVARQPGITLKLELERPGMAASKREELLHPRGRRALIAIENPVMAPGTTFNAVVETWEERADLYCDVVADGAVLWSGNFQSRGHRLNLSMKLPCAGRCDLQCTGHPWEAGEEFATFPVFVTNESSLKVLTAHLDAERILHPASLRVVPGADASLTSRYFTSLLRREPSSPRLWVNTRPDDLEKRSSAASAEKRRILIAMGAVFILVLLVVMDVVLRNTAAQRRRMREFAAETLGEEIPSDVVSALGTQGHQAQLDRTRGILLLIAMLGALIGNLIGIIWLLDLVGPA